MNPTPERRIVEAETCRAARENMVQNQLMARGIRDPRVLEAMGTVPRHRFVPEALAPEAYSDRPLPIGHGQTVSQPYMVALMTEALALRGEERVLEIGTGSGYQAAILAALCREVYTVERVEPILERAQIVLEELGYDNIRFKAFDGTLGWEEHKYYDAALVTAGAPDIPPPLLDQLAVGGRLVIPVGTRFSQQLVKITKSEDRYIRESLGGCRFVDLVGAHGWRR